LGGTIHIPENHWIEQALGFCFRYMESYCCCEV